MRALKRISPAIAGLGLGLGLLHTLPAQAADTPTLGVARHLGRFRTSLGQLSQGLSISLAQSMRYDSNIVRTANSAETFSLYGKRDSSDWISQTSLNVGYVWHSARTQIRFGGDFAYAKYFNFDNFSGWVAGGNGSLAWQFTDRCSTTLLGRVERRLSDFQDVLVTNAGFQDEYDGSADFACALLQRLRVSGGVFIDTLQNEAAAQKVADVQDYGFRAALSVVSPHDNQIGVNYRFSRTHRPNDPLTMDIDDSNYGVFTAWHFGHRITVDASGGYEVNHQKGGRHFHRVSSRVDVRWQVSSRLTARFGFARDIENTPDIVGATSAVDRPRGDITWQINDNASLGGFVEYEDATLNSPVSLIVNGVNERTISSGVYLEHTLFHRLSLRWTVTQSSRTSGLALRNYDDVSAGVSLGLGF